MAGEEITLQAYNIGGNNYLKLRDLAQILNDTRAQFSVGYDSVTQTVTLTGGQPYEAMGGEVILQPEQTLSVTPTQAKLYVNGTLQDVTAYNIDGNNYFKLRDIAQLMNFGVGYDAASQLVLIEPDTEYVG